MPEQITFYTTHKGARYRVSVVIDTQQIARVLGAKAVSNRTHYSRLLGFARARAKLVESDQPTTE